MAYLWGSWKIIIILACRMRMVYHHKFLKSISRGSTFLKPLESHLKTHTEEENELLKKFQFDITKTLLTDKIKLQSHPRHFLGAVACLRAP